MNRIRGKTAIVTGATAGIGEACARALAAMGVHLVLTGRRSERLEALARELGRAGEPEPVTATFDVRDRTAVDDFAARLESDGPAPDILINNAGLARGLNTVQEGSHDDWDDMIDTNLKGLLNMMRAILPGMVERDSGHVVNLGSIAGYVVYPQGAVYCATKFGVRAINQGANIDLLGTRVSACPASIREWSRPSFHWCASAAMKRGPEPSTRAWIRSRPRTSPTPSATSSTRPLTSTCSRC